MLDGFSVVYATIRTGSLQEVQLEAATTRCQLELAAASFCQEKNNKTEPKEYVEYWVDSVALRRSQTGVEKPILDGPVRQASK